MVRVIMFFVLIPFSLVISQWDIQSTPVSTELWCIRAVNDDVVWAGGIIGVVLRTTDGGSTWTKAADPETNFRTYGIDAIDAQTAWVTGTDEATRGYCKIYKTTNGGTNWVQQYSAPSQGLGIRFFDENNGAAFCDPLDNWVILTTTNGGTNWVQVPAENFPAAETREVPDPEIPENPPVIVVNERGTPDLESNGDHAWFVSLISDDPAGKPNYIYHSTDKGHHWTKHAVNLSGGAAEQANVSFKNAFDGVIAGSDGTRGYTTDGGANWTLISPAADYFYSVVHVPGTDAFIAVGDQRVTHITYDIGATWDRYFPGASSNYFLGADASASKAWACGKGGTIAVWNNSVALPVELREFTATQSGGGISLRWTTSSEAGIYGFEIERSAAGSSALWMPIGFVKGSGTTQVPTSYAFVDNTAAGTVRYRLKQIDTDGTYSYSSYIEADAGQLPTHAFLQQNYPNPFNASTTIRFHVAEYSLVRLSVYDAIGREVSVLVNERLEPGSYSVRWNAPGMYSGVYLCSIVINGMQISKAMCLVR